MAPANPVVQSEGELALSPSLTFEAVYVQYFGFVWRCLRGLGIAPPGLDDAAQEVFVVVHRRLPDFRGDSSLRTWLYGIVRNVAANHRRSQRRQPAWVPFELEPASPENGPAERLAETEAAEFVRQFLGRLSDAKRDVFVLALLEELSMPEVARTLQIPLNTAYTRLRSVRQEFQRALHKKGALP